MDAAALVGETLAVPERVIVAPAVGVFRPLPPGAEGTPDLMVDGDVITAGQTIGVVEGPGASTPVCSPFGGSLIGMLARAGERVREGQPVAWLRLS
ncbi:MAG: biotin/lipoyl-containing protein [Acidimicrobiia bacterium]